ncbi:DUF1629 domain-containing protein [Rhizobium sp. R634]|uniref:imm11 family protein n=1 Tax=Rhizobium sp. R634 TaxID=1764274 RepID=UPI001FD97533|nr:DUF1629 domain-containing protein [Rhizobium sp. R634]
MKSKAITYYEVGTARSDRGTGWELVNRERLQADGGGISPVTAWPDGRHVLPHGPWRLPEYLEPPHFVFDRSLARGPRDFDMRDGFFLISSKMKTVLEELAPGDCDFRPCVTKFRNGDEAPELWIGTITKAFPEAVDLEQSNVTVSRFGQYLFPSLQPPKITFKPEIVRQSHVFRLVESWLMIFCDEQFRARCKADDITGISFSKITR